MPGAPIFSGSFSLEPRFYFLRYAESDRMPKRKDKRCIL